MKRKLLFIIILLVGISNASFIKAQCYGTVKLDTYVNANGTSTFKITTTYCNELIMISYDGWPGPGNGPVTVDGNPATHIATAFVYYYAVAETYAYLAPVAGPHTIVCTESPFSSPYYLNSAASFYAIGTGHPLSVGSLTNAQATVTCVGGGTVTANIPTTIPGSMIYDNFDCNNGQGGSYVDSWIGGTFLNQLHIGNGIDQSEAYTNAPTIGTYTVSANCSASPAPCGGLALLLVAIPPPICGGDTGLSASVTNSNPACTGCNGSITINVNGGLTPYTYVWTPNVSTTNVATGLCGGTYSCTVQDASCPAKDTIIVVTLRGDNLILTPNITANESCNGDCVGIATVSVSGGYSPFTYSWAPVGGSTNVATGLCAGTYTVTVFDTSGCSATTTAIITQPAPLAATGVVTNVLCNGGVGTATVTPTGGTSPYTYFWTPSSQTNATATGLRAGTYTIKITDNNGCTVTTSVVLTQPALLTASIGTPTYPPCNGGVGSATAAGNGGTSPYTYSWNPTAQTTATATGLTARTYTVTVTDNNGCTATTSVVITQPAVVGGNIVVVSYPPCNGNTGTATVTASGGTPGYKYLWTNGETIAAATGLLAGSYTVTITDAHGCTGKASITLTQPTSLSVTASFTHASCGLPNGTATASPTGGTAPYAYLWSPGGQTNITATNLLAGTYTVKVTDNHNCTASASVTITQPTPVLASISNIVNVTCSGKNNGSATVVGSGGTAPYGYQWSPAGGSGATGTGLTAGKYVVTVKDANGCTVTAGATITQPTVLSVTVSGGAIRCLGDQGSFTANATGGTSPYGYSWAPGGQTNMIAKLTPPSNITYTVTVTDANGCQALGYISFSFPPPLAVSIAGAAVSCSKRSATLCALATGGTGGDTYLWEPVNLNSPCATVPTLVTTIYTVTVVDNCSVSATASTTITVNPPPPVDFISTATEGCAPVCVQFRNLTPSSGGVESYKWSFGDGDSIQMENPLHCYTKSGQYNVALTVVSDSGCSSTLSKQKMITVYSRPKAAFTYSPQPVTILTPTVQFTDESIDAYGLGYRWWNFGDGSDSVSHLVNPTHTYADTGSYCTTLIEMNNKGCMDTVTNCLIIEPQYNLYIPSAFTPNGDGINETFKPVGQYIRSFEMYIFDRWGIQLYHTTDINQGWNGTVNGSSTSQEDTYIYKITIRDAQGIEHSYIGNVSLIR